MTQPGEGIQPARTILEQRIRERRMTFEEFIRHAQEFVREYNEPGTLSLRHLQRLVTGRRSVESLQPATARLLERIFGESVSVLLAAPQPIPKTNDDTSDELCRTLDAARRVDRGVITLLDQQLNAIRRLDRQLGAIVVHDELTAKVRQVAQLAAHSLSPDTRMFLNALLSEMYTLAGWQALDMGDVAESWSHYEQSKSAAAQSGSVAYESHAIAEQTFVLIDAGQARDAVTLLDAARSRADRHAPLVLRSWLAAAHGEALAADGQRSDSLRAFDCAEALLPNGEAVSERPYVVLDSVHLARWRGHALARFGDPEAVDVLTGALDQLDPSFARAETALRVDLATALATAGERDEARNHAEWASALACQLGSIRQCRRLRRLAAVRK